MGDLQGRAALVTGAASGIGRAIAELFAGEGARVVALDRDPRVADAAPVGGSGVVCDVSDAGGVAAAVGSAGPFDVLVNAAAVTRVGPVGEGSEADWDRVFAVNAKGPWLVTRAVLPGMIAGGRGAIVNISSAAGLLPGPNLGVYAASKAALISLTRSLAVEYADRGIRANCICPGIVDTPLMRATLTELQGGEPDWEALLRAYPLRRLGTPDEIAQAALFLASDRSSFVTGATLAVDAGRTLH